MIGSRLLMIASACAILGAGLVGLAGAMQLPSNGIAFDWLPFALMRPLHEALALGGVLCGAAAATLRIIAKVGQSAREEPVAIAMIAFLAVGLISIAMHGGSGREYTPWPVAASGLLGLALALLLIELMRAWSRLLRRAPEGVWLIGFGLTFLIAALFESALYGLTPLAADPIRDLSIQWHAIDAVFAGLNALLYGCGVLIRSDEPKGLRSIPLFVVAAAGVLFTFAHHHYPSPQPLVFKLLAVAASLLALTSFTRRWREYLSPRAPSAPPPTDEFLWRSVEGWTLASIASGVLFAIPHVNLIVHGTNLIVIHAMGSMIGVGVLIVVASGLRLAPNPASINWRRTRWAARAVNIALVGLWAALGADGLIEGISRLTQDYYLYRSLRDAPLMGFPLFGALLLAGLAALMLELARCYLSPPFVPRLERQAREADTIDGDEVCRHETNRDKP